MSSTLFYNAYLAPSFVFLTSFLQKNAFLLSQHEHSFYYKIQELQAKNFFSNNVKKSNRIIEIILGPLKFGLSFELYCNILSYYTFNSFIKQSIKTIKSDFLFYDCLNFYKKNFLNNFSCSSFTRLSQSENNFILSSSFARLLRLLLAQKLCLRKRKRAKGMHRVAKQVACNQSLPVESSFFGLRLHPSLNLLCARSKANCNWLGAQKRTEGFFCNTPWVGFAEEEPCEDNLKIDNSKIVLNHIIRKNSKEIKTERTSKALKKILIKKNIIYELLSKKQNLVINNQNFFYVLKQLIEFLKQIRPFKFILHLKRYLSFNLCKHSFSAHKASKSKNLKNFFYFNIILKSFYPYNKTSNFVLNSFEIENYLKLKMFFLITKFTKINLQTLFKSKSMSFNMKQKNTNIEYIKLYNIGFHYGSFLLNFNINIFDIVNILYKNFYISFLKIFLRILNLQSKIILARGAKVSAKRHQRSIFCQSLRSFTPLLLRSATSTIDKTECSERKSTPLHALTSTMRRLCQKKSAKKIQKKRRFRKVNLRLMGSKIDKNKRLLRHILHPERKKLKLFKIRSRKRHIVLNKNFFKIYKINLFKYKFFKSVLEKLYLNKKIKKKKYLHSFASSAPLKRLYSLHQSTIDEAECRNTKFCEEVCKESKQKTSIFSLCTKYKKSLKKKNLFLYNFKKFFFNYSFFTIYKNFQIIKIQNKSKFFLIKKWDPLKTIYQKISNYIWKKNKISFFYETNYSNIFYNSKFANCLITDKNNIFVLNSKYNIINKFAAATIAWNKKFNINCSCASVRASSPNQSTNTLTQRSAAKEQRSEENIFCLKKKILSVEKMYSLKKNGLNFKGFFLFFISDSLLNSKKEKFNTKESLIIDYLTCASIACAHSREAKKRAKVKKEIFILKNHKVQNFYSQYFNFKINTGLIPSKKLLKKHLNLLKNIILKYNSQTQKKLLYKLSFKIINWSYYYKIVTNSQLFYYCDSLIYKLIWKWACRNHPNKSKKWIQQKYFFSLKNKKWVFGILPKNFNSKSSKKNIFYLPFHNFLINF
uniref:Group II intron maturase-specific domain-containing protein n=1 Tax=Pseudopediastrum boryanum TaxID=55410 RepID=A0A2U8GIZ1_PSEBY|nr:hypothetical protein [Pseudopediastrum boryanum]AWI68599.1 hypothetical protein [Pseudopediastrum boryanum]